MPGNTWPWAAQTIASMASPTAPVVVFFMPTGIARPLVSARCVWLCTVRAPIAPQQTTSDR